MGRKRTAPNRAATRKPVDPHADELRRLRSDPWAAAALASGAPIEMVREGFLGRHPDVRLSEIARELVAVDTRRRELLAERAQVVAQLRRSGWSWNRLADTAGVSRPALIQAAG